MLNSTVRLDSLIDFPVSLPSVSVGPGDWLEVALFRLEAPATATLRFLSLSVHGFPDTPSSTGSGQACVCPGDSDGGVVVSGRGAACLGLYYTDTRGCGFNIANVALQQVPVEPVLELPLNTSAPNTVYRGTDAGIYNNPGVYRFIVSNNTPKTYLSLSVSGQIRLDLNP